MFAAIYAAIVQPFIKVKAKEKENEFKVLRKLTPPLASTIAITAAASITHDKGFHIKLRNFKNLFS